jgi:hypothetical protein
MTDPLAGSVPIDPNQGPSGAEVTQALRDGREVMLTAISYGGELFSVSYRWVDNHIETKYNPHNPFYEHITIPYRTWNKCEHTPESVGQLPYPPSCWQI